MEQLRELKNASSHLNEETALLTILAGLRVHGGWGPVDGELWQLAKGVETF